MASTSPRGSALKAIDENRIDSALIDNAQRSDGPLTHGQVEAGLEWAVAYIKANSDDIDELFDGL
jgi:hypothetical protein